MGILQSIFKSRDKPQNAASGSAYLFIAKVKCRKLQTAFVGDCRSNGWGECRS